MNELFFDCAAFEEYRVDLPYPRASIPEHNLRQAALISGAYAGQGSETTAIAQYATHRFFTAEYPDVYKAYLYIAATEMIHFSLLGELILALGLKPALYSYETDAFWVGSNPDYQFHLAEILQSDLKGERDAIAHYTRLIAQIDNPSIQTLFRRIILDEEKHVRLLSELYDRYFRNT